MNRVTSILALHHVVLIHVTGVLGFLGFSVLLAIMHDILFFCSLWIFGCYSIFAKFYSASLSMMTTQWKMFTGRKFNVIRNRDDSSLFSLTEFYFGVTVVSIALFLLPTFASFYYYCFLEVILNVLVL
jgi:phosphatidylinositol glycan class Q protein